MRIYLLDACFVINLLVEESPYHMVAYELFTRLAQDRDVILKMSAIAVSEFAIKGDVTTIPPNVQKLAFNYTHAIKAGEFGRICKDSRKEANDGSDRTIVLSDSKMFAQAQIENIKYFVTADHKAKKTYDYLRTKNLVSFDFIDITTMSCAEIFGEIDFPTL